MFGYEVNWHTMIETWSNLSMVVQIILLGVALYVHGCGSYTAAKHTVKAVIWGYTKARAWWTRPSRVAVLEDKLTTLLAQLGVEDSNKNK